ncbi:PREDICTED: basic proline-rich protein-like [Dipodomys ordii]|uniref:Basic proline-rich protein-like n=1 Tax=Dipodomys ordii TaxID=10020 RepID=A0A1S3EXJ8_DIPOR|nr:PREDICTED: basic proline-rich protein-like [Dipodomys ordii]
MSLGSLGRGAMLLEQPMVLPHLLHLSGSAGARLPGRDRQPTSTSRGLGRFPVPRLALGGGAPGDPPSPPPARLGAVLLAPAGGLTLDPSRCWPGSSPSSDRVLGRPRSAPDCLPSEEQKSGPPDLALLTVRGAGPQEGAVGGRGLPLTLPADSQGSPPPALPSCDLARAPAPSSVSPEDHTGSGFGLMVSVSGLPPGAAAALQVLPEVSHHPAFLPLKCDCLQDRLPPTPWPPASGHPKRAASDLQEQAQGRGSSLWWQHRSWAGRGLQFLVLLDSVPVRCAPAAPEASLPPLQTGSQGPELCLPGIQAPVQRHLCLPGAQDHTDLISVLLAVREETPMGKLRLGEFKEGPELQESEGPPASASPPEQKVVLCVALQSAGARPGPLKPCPPHTVSPSGPLRAQVSTPVITRKVELAPLPHRDAMPPAPPLHPHCKEKALVQAQSRAACAGRGPAGLPASAPFRAARPVLAGAGPAPWSLRVKLESRALQQAWTASPPDSIPTRQQNPPDGIPTRQRPPPDGIPTRRRPPDGIPTRRRPPDGIPTRRRPHQTASPPDGIPTRRHPPPDGVPTRQCPHQTASPTRRHPPDGIPHQTASTRRHPPPDGIPHQTASPPDGVPTRRRPHQTASPPDGVHQTASPPDGIPTRRHPPPDGVHQTASPPDGIPHQTASPPDGIPHQTASPPDGIHQTASPTRRHPPDGIPTRRRPHQTASPPDGVPTRRRPPPDGIPTRRLNPPDG